VKPDARTIYIDHSIVSTESLWPHLEQVLGTSKIRLVLSLWNLYEISRATDRAQQERRLAYLLGFNPLWIFERVAVEKYEIRRFLWRHRYNRDHEEMTLITPYLWIVDSHLHNSRINFGMTARQFVRRIDHAMLDPLRTLSPDALRDLQTADNQLMRGLQREMFMAWLNGLMPRLDPDGQVQDVPQRAELLEFCYRRQSQFLKECPALAVEDALMVARTGNPRRNPTDSDGPDLQHAAVAMAYCDIFFTADGYQANCAGVARRRLTGARVAELCADHDQLAQAVAAIQT
jgi:hypothetical protein